MISFQKRHVSKPCHKSIVTDVVHLFFSLLFSRSSEIFLSRFFKENIYFDFLSSYYLKKKKFINIFISNNIIILSIILHLLILLIHKVTFSFFVFKKSKLIDLFSSSLHTFATKFHSTLTSLSRITYNSYRSHRYLAAILLKTST